MVKKISIISVCIFLMGTIFAQVAFSQAGDESFRLKLESILNRFKNYRFSTVSVFQMKDIKEIRAIIKAKDDAAAMGQNAANVNADCLKNIDAQVISIIQRGVNDGLNNNQVQREIFKTGASIPDDFDCAYNYYAMQNKGETKVVRNVYLVTTRVMRDEAVPESIIAMIISYEDKNMPDNIKNPAPSLIFTQPELQKFQLDPKEYRAENMYELVNTAFLQGNVSDKTLEARGIGTMMTFATKKYGLTNSVIVSESDITSMDIQRFKRVSEGQALNIKDKFNELIVGPDLISWRKYDYPQYFYPDGTADTTSRITNDELPKYGMELRYGIDNINYPSLWSERLTLSAMWDGMKLGLILPTSGWASISKDLFKVDRKFTTAGTGIAGELDFPIRVIPKSGVFNLSFGYVFGDATEGPVKRNLDPDTLHLDPNNLSMFDYLIRFNASLHYTFGVQIDESYLLRFGIGATAYSVEKWWNEVVENPDTKTNELKYANFDTDAIGGISGKIDFMATKLSTPFGASLQYFDEALFTNFWLQIPVIENTFSVRLDAKGYFKAFTDKQHDWESKSLFIPMAKVIFHF